MQKWEILYTTDQGASTKPLYVYASSLTEAILQGARELPASCFIGTDDTSGIISVKKCD